MIGRLGAAALSIHDPRISEAHALVSLRAGQLQLLGLRGRFRVHGKVRAQVALEDGLEVELAEGLVLHVDRVVLPPTVLGVRLPGIPDQILGSTVTVQVAPTPRLTPGWTPDAPLTLWRVDDRWFARTAEGDTPIQAGDRLAIAGVPIEILEIPTAAGPNGTTAAEFSEPVRIDAHVDTVTVTVGAAPPTVIGGLPGRVLAELVVIGGPITWDGLARGLWHDADGPSLRRRWDITLTRLRGRLRDLGAHPHLIHADGTGHIQLLLRPGDQAVAHDG